jgi:hypothetical protein
VSRHRFFSTGIPGILRCACGVQCMAVVRLAGRVATLRAITLYRYPLLTNTGKPGGIIRAKGWSAWSTHQPGHVTPRARTNGGR